jgi:hypothetical protein
MGFGDGEPARELGVNLAIGRTLVLPEPANAHEHIIAIRGARGGHALGHRREQTHARARTRRVRAAAGACGNGEEPIERLHGLIPGKIVPRHQEVTAVEAGQQFRLINDALFGV